MKVVPRLMNKMTEAKKNGKDVNKPGKPKIPEMGGIAALWWFSIAITFVLGVERVFDLGDRRIYVLAAVSVFLMSAFVGLIDDIATLSTRGKIIYVALASIPLIIVSPGAAVIAIPFNGALDFTTPYMLYLFFWIFIVPLGVTGAANALNMSAGYNGLETGQIAVISFFLLIIARLKGADDGTAVLIFGTLLGTAIALYYYNRYPAKTFIGDVGTLGMGAMIAAGVIIGKIEFYGLICIIPAFYELGSTVYHEMKGIKRRGLCHSPKIMKDGRLRPPKGAEKYTLCYVLLNDRPMTEKKLVNTVLVLYIACGLGALFLCLAS